MGQPMGGHGQGHNMGMPHPQGKSSYGMNMYGQMGHSESMDRYHSEYGIDHHRYPEDQYGRQPQYNYSKDNYDYYMQQNEYESRLRKQEQQNKGKTALQYRKSNSSNTPGYYQDQDNIMKRIDDNHDDVSESEGGTESEGYDCNYDDSLGYSKGNRHYDEYGYGNTDPSW